jgi:hypothetical protein
MESPQIVMDVKFGFVRERFSFCESDELTAWRLLLRHRTEDSWEVRLKPFLTVANEARAGLITVAPLDEKRIFDRIGSAPGPLLGNNVAVVVSAKHPIQLQRAFIVEDEAD